MKKVSHSPVAGPFFSPWVFFDVIINYFGLPTSLKCSLASYQCLYRKSPWAFSTKNSSTNLLHVMGIPASSTTKPFLCPQIIYLILLHLFQRKWKFSPPPQPFSICILYISTSGTCRRCGLVQITFADEGLPVTWGVLPFAVCNHHRAIRFADAVVVAVSFVGCNVSMLPVSFKLIVWDATDAYY